VREGQSGPNTGCPFLSRKHPWQRGSMPETDSASSDQKLRILDPPGPLYDFSTSYTKIQPLAEHEPARLSRNHAPRACVICRLFPASNR